MDQPLPLAVKVEGERWTPELARSSAEKLFQGRAFQISAINGNVGVEGLLTSKDNQPDNRQSNNRQSNNRQSNNGESERIRSLTVFSGDKIVWRAVIDLAAYHSPSDETLQENPWRALAIPKTFRIPQARLPGSYPTSDGFVESDYYRDYSDSIAEGTSEASRRQNSSNGPPPSMGGSRGGRPGGGNGIGRAQK